MKISKKPFSLDPSLANMKDNITSTSKQMNWNVICKELKVSGTLRIYACRNSVSE
jgi:hypothetical protein